MAIFAMVFVSCVGRQERVDDKVNKQTEQAMQQSQKEAGYPRIINFQEKKWARMIYELRDRQDLVTYTYIVSMHGKLVFLTKSIGYGLPYSTQFSNPLVNLRDKGAQGGNTVLPQPEPNGLFPAEGLSATWILAVTEKGDIKPMYVEPEIIVSPIKLHKDPNDKNNKKFKK